MRRAAWSGTAKGALAGGLADFWHRSSSSAGSYSRYTGRHFDFDRGMLITPGVGMAVGARGAH
jgi:hypothetical protein